MYFALLKLGYIKMLETWSSASGLLKASGLGLFLKEVGLYAELDTSNVLFLWELCLNLDKEMSGECYFMLNINKWHNFLKETAFLKVVTVPRIVKLI